MSDTLTNAHQYVQHQCFVAMVPDFMEEVFSITAYSWQQDIIVHLCMMQITCSGISPAPASAASCSSNWWWEVFHL
jgi:hypothetical protein